MSTDSNLRIATLFIAAATAAAGSAYAQTSSSVSSTTAHEGATSLNVQSREKEAEAAQSQVDQAAQVVNEMKANPGIARLLEQAHGVLIVPHYAKGAFIVGGEGGAGVALLKNHGAGMEWTPPAFFHIGGINIGAEAGGESGSIAMLLMNEKAADMLMSEKNKFSFNADAGLTVANWSADAQGSAGDGDVILWSDTKGAFVGAAIGVKDIRRDEDANKAYYGRTVEPHAILTGQVTAAHADTLRDALAKATG